MSVFSSLSTNSAFSPTTAGPSLSRATFPDVAQISQEQNEAFEVKTQTSIQNSFFEKRCFCFQSSKHWRQSVANIAMIQSFQGPLLSTTSHSLSPPQPLKSDCNPPVGSGAFHSSKMLLKFEKTFQNPKQTGNIGVVKDRRKYFASDLPSCVLRKRQNKFLLRYSCAVNSFFCKFSINMQHLRLRDVRCCFVI